MHSAIHLLAQPYITSAEGWQLFSPPGFQRWHCSCQKQIRTPDPELIKNKEVTHMVFRDSNHNTSMRPKAQCVMCGAGIDSRGTRSLELLCLICRAAILDRIFQARRKQLRVAGRHG